MLLNSVYYIIRLNNKAKLSRTLVNIIFARSNISQHVHGHFDKLRLNLQIKSENDFIIDVLQNPFHWCCCFDNQFFSLACQIECSVMNGVIVFSVCELCVLLLAAAGNVIISFT